MKQHVGMVEASCFYHLCRWRQIRCWAGKEVTTQLEIAFVMSRLDYCDSVLTGLPQATLEPLQRVQNASVLSFWSSTRVITWCDPRSDSVALVAIWLSYPVQVVLYRALHTCRQMSGFHGRLCPIRSWQCNSVRTAVSWVDAVRYSTAQIKVWWMVFFSCWSSCLQLSSTQTS